MGDIFDVNEKEYAVANISDLDAVKMATDEFFFSDLARQLGHDDGRFANMKSRKKISKRRGAHYTEAWAELSEMERADLLSTVGSNTERSWHDDLDRATRGMTDRRQRELMELIAEEHTNRTGEEMEPF